MSSSFNNPFGALGNLRDRLPAPAEPAAKAPDTAPPAREGKSYPRAVVRMERAGRGGKEATVIEHLALSPHERAAWLKSLKSALGCGGSLEGDAIMLQGDQRDRLVAVLQKMGVKKVVKG
jgi:translation initiation factor 1